MSPPLSLIIVHHDQISDQHLDFLIDALNRQTVQDFNTLWISQVPDPAAAHAKLQARARFTWRLFQTRHPLVAGVVCWELTDPFARLLELPEIGRWFSYLHLECLPEPNLVQNLLALLPEIERNYGLDAICMLHQLWTDLEVDELDPLHYIEQLRLSDPLIWHRRLPYDAYRQKLSFAYWEYRWEEDAFLMSSALARELQLFSAVRAPLYFQDVFDIFEWLGQRPYGERIHWLRIQDAIIYHLRHPRLFREYSRKFLDAVRAHPEIFAHLALYDVAGTERFYSESEAERVRNHTNETLNNFYNTVRHAGNGSLTLWQRYLDQAHGLEYASGLRPDDEV
ncbi:MAG: hypothetical protein ACAI44_23565 [Candidatus Sericytochromatia bacterium]